MGPWPDVSKPPHILVADDAEAIRTMLRRYLSGEGFEVTEAADGDGVRSLLEGEAVDLVLLDLVMPGEDGLSLVREIRRTSSVPIIVLTGKGDLIDRVAGLEAGADDYIAKPFHLREVLARIRTVLRRSAAPSPPTPPAESGQQTLLFRGFRLNLVRRELSRPDGEQVSLTAGEFDLLRVFALHPNQVLNRDQLMDLIKGREWASYDRAIDSRIARLRRKIEPHPDEPALIKTVRGAGYVFAASVMPGPNA
ncbi:MAG: response regulator [Rhodospirillales bacterium]|nr:response regulator [Rhodospirillales bacterium]